MPPSKISREDVLKYDTFLFDADGVLWTGDIPISGAIDFVATLFRAGKSVFIISNNSTKTLDQYVEKVAKMGFEGFSKKNIITPAIVLSVYLRDRPEYAGQPVYLLGMENLERALESVAGVHCIGVGPDHFVDHSSSDFIFNLDLSLMPKAVICSYDAHLSYPKIMKAANFLKRNGVEFFATNEDYTFPGPNPDIVIPGAGCTSAAVRAVSGRTPIVFGKPHKPIADFLRNHEHIDANKTIMFGDRLDTDIQFANDNGFTSCLMLTGVSSLEDVENAKKRGETNRIPKHTGQQMNPSEWQKQSHSSLLSTSENIYEFATHNYHPGEKERYLDTFVGSWTVSFGRTKDQAIHLWRYTKGYKDVDRFVYFFSEGNAVS
ncbi:unnamed protein product [Angiostrongylus costaricensis]|uniref:4-nitrophenylphosphatase n=1 Tax=Angiostrongylus costaricensis TaxID=334426 RepID=A0A158PHM2_ANGCS|nr:unnamed protein product [Angiostrongylus costaricensis]